jgi:membrane associated rhomboid family serine protease
MSRRGEDSGGTPQIAFPKLTPAVKAMLIGIVALFVIQMIEGQWLQLGTERMKWLGVDPAHYLVLFPRLVVERFQAWRLVAWPLVQIADPSALLWACLGLYFFGTDLEQAYGTRRFVLFTLVAVFLAGIVATLYGLVHSSFYTLPVLGVAPFGFAVTAAWGATFPHKRLMFPPVSGRVLVWIVLGMASLTILARASHESPAASIGAIGVGYLLGKYWNRIDDLLDRHKLKSLKAKRDRGLRVVVGGKIDEKDLKKRKPVDKRYLN